MTQRDWTEGLTDEEIEILSARERALSAESTWLHPPEHLRASILDLARQEGANPVHDGGTTDGRVFEPGADLRDPRRSRWIAWSAGIAVAAVAATLFVNTRADPVATTFVVAGTELAPKAQATAEVVSLAAGVAIKLNISGLPPAPPGTYYSAWLMGSSGTVPAGSFHWREGGIPVGLWSGVEPADYPVFFVTLQDESDDPTPTNEVVMEGTFEES